MDQSEAKTRQDIIDKTLDRSGWNVSDHAHVSLEFDLYLGPSGRCGIRRSIHRSSVRRLFTFRERSKTALWLSKPKTSKDARIGKEQAKQYAENIHKVLSVDTPFVFYSNGFDTYFWDMENYPPRRVYGFPTLQELDRMRFINKEKNALSVELINKNIAGRDYQIQAIRTVLDHIEGKRRKFLLVMATGTGENSCLCKFSKYVDEGKTGSTGPFSCGCIALQEQALEGFKDYLPDSQFGHSKERIFFA